MSNFHRLFIFVIFFHCSRSQRPVSVFQEKENENEKTRILSTQTFEIEMSCSLSKKELGLLECECNIHQQTSKVSQMALLIFARNQQQTTHC